MKNSRKLAVCSLISALSLVVMIAAYFPYLTYALPALAGIMLIVLVIEVDMKWAVTAYFAVALQISAMILLVFEDGGMPVVIISLIAIFVPVIAYSIQKKRGKIRLVAHLGEDEITFDEKYPVKLKLK